MALIAATLIGIGVFGVVRVLLSGEPTNRSRGATGKVGYLAVSVVAVLGGFATGSVMGGTVATGFPLAVLAVGLPRALRRRVRRDRARARRQAWPDCLHAVSSAVLSGHSLQSALLSMGDEGPHALRDFWKRYRRLSSMLDTVTALETLRAEVADPFVDRVVEVLIAAQGLGPVGTIDILNELAESAADDIQFEMQVASANLEQKINSRVVAIVPSLALFVMVWTNDGAQDFYSSTPGVIVAIVGSVIIAAGIVVIDRLGRTEDEPRTFAIISKPATQGARR